MWGRLTICKVEKQDLKSKTEILPLQNIFYFIITEVLKISYLTLIIFLSKFFKFGSFYFIYLYST